MLKVQVQLLEDVRAQLNRIQFKYEEQKFDFFVCLIHNY